MPGASEPSSTRVLSFEQAPEEKSFPQEARQELTPEKAFTESLRAVVRDELGKCGLETKPKEETAELRPLQAVFLLAFALDLTFLYLWFVEHSKAGEIGEFLAKLLPALGGTLAFSYFDRVRRWLLGHSRSPWFGVLFITPAVFFLVTLIPIYSLVLRVDAGSPQLKEADTGEIFHCDGGYCFLSGLRLRSYDVLLSCKDGITTRYSLGYPEILRSLVIRLALFHKLKPRLLEAKYKLDITYPNPSGVLYVSTAEADDLDDPVQNGLWSAGPATPVLAVRGHCWQKNIQGRMDELILPGGNYTFTQKNNGMCSQTTLDLTSNDNLDFLSNRKQKCE
jgi:hypothetical protein